MITEKSLLDVRAQVAAELAEARYIEEAPKRAQRLATRLLGIEHRLGQLAREQVAEQHDPRWRAKLTEAELAATAAEAVVQRLQAQRLALARRASSKLDEPALLNRIGSIDPTGLGTGATMAGTFLPDESPELAAARLTASSAARRLRELREWPAKLVASLANPPRTAKDDEGE